MKRRFTQREQIEYQSNLETMLENEREENERVAIQARHDRVWNGVTGNRYGKNRK